MFGHNVVFLYFILFYNIMLLDGFDVFPMMVLSGYTFIEMLLFFQMLCRNVELSCSDFIVKRIYSKYIAILYDDHCDGSFSYGMVLHLILKKDQYG